MVKCSNQNQIPADLYSLDRCGIIFFGYAVSLNLIIMGIKPGPKRIADSTGKPDKRQRDNKESPGNTPSLKPHKHKKGD